jgi:hypothetical protein
VDDASLPRCEWYLTEAEIPAVRDYFKDDYHKGNPGSEENFGQRSHDLLMKRPSICKCYKSKMSMHVLLYITNHVVATMAALVFN